MYSSNTNSINKRKEKTIEAHRVLLRADEKDITGQVTFYFVRGEGLVGYDEITKTYWPGYGKNILKN